MIASRAEQVRKHVAGGITGTFSIYQVRPHRADPKASAWTIVMSEIDFKPKLKQKTKVQRPKLYKVMLLNDDYTPREFVVLILKAEFRLDESQAEVVMMTAHQKGVCVVSVYPRDVAETKATRAIDAAVRLGYPLQFTVEPE
jgi:ATP-dependent Clp protease adaptor protein ClpS